MNRQNNPTNVGTTDPSSGAVYTSETNIDQGPGVAAGAVYTSGTNSSSGMTSSISGSMGTNSMNSMGQSSTMGSMGQNSTMNSVGSSNVGVNNVQQIKQQLQDLQTQLRQSQGSGTASQAYTDAANRLQDVYEILNNAK